VFFPIPFVRESGVLKDSCWSKGLRYVVVADTETDYGLYRIGLNELQNLLFCASDFELVFGLGINNIIFWM
jgi:hypothetical protein